MYTKPDFVRRKARGFTLIELIVALGLSVLIAGLCTMLFNQTSLAVRTGAATSDMLGNLRMVTDQMQRDANDMLGPVRPIGNSGGSVDEGGYLVIVQRNTIKNNTWINTPALTEINETIANDEIAFICRRGSRQPICPGAGNGFSNTIYAPYVAVWYGHGWKTLHNGCDYAGPNDALGSDAPNHLANRWVLARRALFLNGPAGLSNFNIYAQGVAPTAPVNGYGAGGYPWSANPQLYMGLTDVSNWSLADLNNNAGFDPQDLTATNVIANTYRPVRVNPTPGYGTIDTGDANPPSMYAKSFWSWQVAQNHASFLNNVSDFEVAYAFASNPGDPIGTPPIKWERNPGTPGVGHVYVAAPDNNTTATGGNLTRIAWPKLIRIRWRMHDFQVRLGAKTSTSGNQGEAGRWYEQIIRVKND